MLEQVSNEMMELTGLRPLYNYLRINNELYTSFEFTKNNVKFDVLFDIYHNPFKLIFIQINGNFTLSIDVKTGFKINPNLKPKDYKALCKTLGLKFDPNNKFSPFAFFEEFNNNIPQQPKEKTSYEKIYRLYESDVEESEKIYYWGKIEWNKLSNSKGNVTKENLFKTSILFSKLYSICLNNNIRIIYKKKEIDIIQDFNLLN